MSAAALVAPPRIGRMQAVGAYMSQDNPTQFLSKHARKVRAEILAALDSLPLPDEVAEFSDYWKHLGQPADSRASLDEYRAHLEARGLAPNLIDQRITVVRKWVQLFKSEPPVVHVPFSVPLFQFQAADPDISEESFEEWKARVSPDHQRAWEHFLDEQEGRVWRAVLSDKPGSPLLNETLIGGPIAYPKPQRGPGETGRNLSFEDRRKCAAEWLLGRDWLDIAVQYLKPGPAEEVQKAADKVRSAATPVLRTAGFDKTDRLPAKRK